MARILSIDVGIKNLSYCIFNIIDGKPIIYRWDVISVLSPDMKCHKVPIDVMTERVLNTLEETFENDTIAPEGTNTILIENQPSLIASPMKTIQNIISTYFYCRKVLKKENIEAISLISAGNKAKVKRGPECILTEKTRNEKNKYKKRKACSIEFAVYYLTNCIQDEEKLEYFNTSKKQDDLADSFLQGIHYIETKLKLKL